MAMPTPGHQTAARHTRYADPEGPLARAAARLRRRPAHHADVRRRATCGRGLALPGALPDRAAGVDHRRMGRVGEQSSGKFYKLTRAGRKQLQIEEENWERLAGA